MAQILLNDLGKDYGTKHVLQHISLTLSVTGCTVLLGKSGCGKTTFLRLLAGLEEPTNGSLSMPENLKLGMMFQEARLFPWLTCRENIALGLPDKKAKARVDELLSLVQLTEAAAKYPSQLSGGMQQRAALARTLAMESDLILMDEPFAALDYFTRGQLQQEMLRMQQRLSLGLILVTHNVDEALTLGTRLLILKEGSIAWDHCLQQPPWERDLLSPELIDVKRSILVALA